MRKPLIIKTEQGDQQILKFSKIGPLAIHRTWPAEDNPDEWTITHIQSGLFVLRFTAIVSRSRVETLARDFARLDFDTYYAGGCKDKAFQKEAKIIYKRFMALYGLGHTIDTGKDADQ